VQIAKARGAKVLTTCGSANRAYVNGLGASEVFDYSCDDVIGRVHRFFPDGIDVVFSNAFGDLHKLAYGLVKRGGTLVTIGEPSIPDLAEQYGIRDFDHVVRPNGDQLAKIARLIDSGKIRPPSITEFPLNQCGDAFRLSMQGHVRGKIVLRMS
jgi:NADPH2:quinone reductase